MGLGTDLRVYTVRYLIYPDLNWIPFSHGESSTGQVKDASSRYAYRKRGREISVQDKNHIAMQCSSKKDKTRWPIHPSPPSSSPEICFLTGPFTQKHRGISAPSHRTSLAEEVWKRTAGNESKNNDSYHHQSNPTLSTLYRDHDNIKLLVSYPNRVRRCQREILPLPSLP